VSSSYESANLLIKLYDLRREEKMREARNWFFREFNPTSAADMMAAMAGPNSAHFRMVVSYWDMACSFVNNGAINEQMFNDANGEQLGVYAKVEPYLTEFRTMVGNPGYLASLEKVVMRRPGGTEMIAAMRERLRAMAATAGK
jgi:hypothetical protein